MARVAATAFGPERRMMATPPVRGTTGVAIAAMVSPSFQDEEEASSSSIDAYDVASSAAAAGGTRPGTRVPRRSRRGLAEGATATATARPRKHVDAIEWTAACGGVLRSELASRCFPKVWNIARPHVPTP